MSGENKMISFNPFKNDFECSICYDYCYDDKVDCKTCSASICNKCYKELNKNKALRNKCVICRKAMKNRHLSGLEAVYQFNIMFINETQKNLLYQVAKFFKGTRRSVSVSNISWFVDFLPLHIGRDGGRVSKWRGKRIIWESLFPKDKKEPITQHRTRDELGHYNFMLNQNYQILFYRNADRELIWGDSSVEVYKKNTASVKLRINNYEHENPGVFHLTDKCYKVMSDSARVSDASLTGCKMGNYIILDKTPDGIFFINSMM